MPLTGPRQVVPEYGSRSVRPLSSTEPVPFNETAQLGMPDIVAVAVTVNGTDVPLS